MIPRWLHIFFIDRKLQYFICVFSCSFSLMAESGRWLDFPPLLTFEKNEPISLRSVECLALGPIVEYSATDNNSSLIAFRPLFSFESKPEYSAMDIIWPLFVLRHTSYEKYWRFLLLYQGNIDKSGAESHPHMGFIPLWFCGYDKKDEFYWAFFPVYGDVHDFLSYDSIVFFLFPLCMFTEKGETSGGACLWPLIDWENGPRLEKFRIIPFYAYHHRFGQFDKASYMWPLFHTAEYLNPKTKGSGWLFWPLVGHRTVNDFSSWTFLWPLFSTYRKGEDGFGIYCPWPVFQYKHNVPANTFSGTEEYWRLYFWPVWGEMEKPGSAYNFLLWPFGSTLSVKNELGSIDWMWALPLFWSKDAWNKNGERIEIYRRFWPLASYHESGKSCEFRILDLWPQRNMPVIERNWNPLWILYSYIENEKGFKHTCLWNIFTYSETADKEERFLIFPFYSSHYSPVETSKAEDSKDIESTLDFLMGIFRIRRTKEGETCWRFFWLIEF